MNRRLKLFSLMLALFAVAAIAMPGMAQAATKTGFSATAEVMVTDPGTSTQVGKNRIRTRGEVIEGVFTSVIYDGCTDCDPLHILGAPIRVNHSSTIRLKDIDPDAGGIGEFTGRARALFKVDTAQGILFGMYRARLTGTYTLQQDGQLAILSVVDEGKWRAMGRVLNDGRFVKAKGDWEAALHLGTIPGTGGVQTLAGMAMIGGEYKPVGRWR
jgi:hypothetical protein